MLDKNKTVFEISLKDMDIKIFVVQLKLMAMVMVYFQICAIENALVYCNKATCVDMLNDAVPSVKQYNLLVPQPRPEVSYKIGSVRPFVDPSVCLQVFSELGR